MEKVSNKEYWEQTNFYSDLVVEKAKDDINKLKELINNLDNLPQPSIEKLLTLLSSEKIISQSDEIKTNLWNALVDFTLKHKRFADAKRALDKEIVYKIELVASKLEPKNPLYLYARLFSSRDVDLFEESGNWDEQHKKLSNRRQQALKDILNNGGIDAVLDFLNNVDSQTNVGYALGAIADDAIDEKILPICMNANNKKLFQFIHAYVWIKYYDNGWVWVDRMLSKSWTKIQKADFLTFLPFILDTWKRVTEILADSEFLYWEKTYINPYQSDGDLTLAIDKLIEFGRPHAALDCINKILYDKKPLDVQRAVRALLAGITSKESSNMMDVHNITEIIKALQEDDSISEDDLFRIEWGYLQLLDGYNSVSPKYLGSRLANDSSFFCELIRKIYRSKKASAVASEPTETDKAIATRAWELLYHWQTPPGTRKDNQFDGRQFTIWLNEVKCACDESGHLEVALSHIGKVLFYVPDDSSGFWIQKIVAEELNKKEVEEMRNGFSTEVYNSRGTYWVDPTGKPEIELAKAYRKKADETENAGFQRLALTLRKVAESYENDAKRIIEEHKREIEEDKIT
ncbi:MAG: hypothetical protein M1495_16345 [Bacteroidetes bacterium]|nr:hypothetical protein [Bacteroidota bacterium]